MTWVAIDPGELHCGVAIFQGATLKVTHTWSPPRLFDWLESAKVDRVVCEGYWLYPWLLQEQGFSEVLTAQTIGVIKYICGKRRIRYHQQKATIKKPTAAIMKRSGVKLPGRTKGGIHENDAVLHGYRYLLDEEGWTPWVGSSK